MDAAFYRRPEYHDLCLRLFTRNLSAVDVRGDRPLPTPDRARNTLFDRAARGGAGCREPPAAYSERSASDAARLENAGEHRAIRGSVRLFDPQPDRPIFSRLSPAH